MLLKFNEPSSLTGARLDSCLPLRLMYGSQQTLELDCVYGSENTPIDMQGKQCTRWVVSLLKNLSTPSDPLVSETFEDNIAVNNRLYMTLPLTTMALYKYVAGGASICLLDIRGYEDGETVASVAFQVPVLINGAMPNRAPLMHKTTEVNDGTLTFTRNGEVVATFSANTPLNQVVELSESEYDALKGVKAVVVNGEYIPVTPTGVVNLNIPVMQDDDTITDITGQLRAEGLIDRNISNGASLKVWKGTYQEWVEQEKNQTNDICIITDDMGETAEYIQYALDAEDAIRRAEQSIEGARAVLQGLEDIASGLVFQAEKGRANGIPTLDDNGKVPQEQLPSIHSQDDSTITLNALDKMQAVGLKETNAGVAKKIWVGTLAQYEAQDKDNSDDLCFVVDDDQASQGSAQSGGIIARTPPTENTRGTIGQFYADIETGTLYMCTGIVESPIDGTLTYRWKPCGSAAQEVQQEQADWNENDSSAPSFIKNKPTIPTAQIQADWNQSSTTAKDFIKNKPGLATVATTGSYNDLADKPSIPAAQVQANWNETSTSSKAYVQNKPTLASVATSGSYNDLSNKPAIPTANDYIPQSQKGAANGVAGLDGNGLVTEGELPIRSNGSDGITFLNGYIAVSEASSGMINQRSGIRPIVPSRLNYAVTAALTDSNHITLTAAQKVTAQEVLGLASVGGSPITVIPAASTVYTFSDGGIYTHAPENPATYTLPAVTDAAHTHECIITVDFTAAQTVAFEQSDGTAPVMLETIVTPIAGDVVEYLCRYDAVQGKWVISCGRLNA